MTHAEARETASREAALFGLPMAVYRMPAWPDGVFSVRMPAKLPSEAVQYGTFDPPANQHEAEKPESDQGSLF